MARRGRVRRGADLAIDYSDVPNGSCTRHIDDYNTELVSRIGSAYVREYCAGKSPGAVLHIATRASDIYPAPRGKLSRNIDDCDPVAAKRAGKCMFSRAMRADHYE